MKVLVGIAVLLAFTGAHAKTPHVNDGVLVDDDGMTLYTFGGSGPPDPKSCEGDCARNFPPALAAPGDRPSSEFTLVPMANGTSQWAYEGKLLYRGLMDKKPGDRHGDGLNQVWHTVQP
ncbi:COG4315 family predicted lipoprotein [Paraburkholderia sp. SOS3]|jgi:predicted lipoprotein with Yx(FWY)xxD motif|uniref:COG4315 family predicted lipoprotein n=1 Tax=Paraburkholderia sp. SOS3 TaxID=1926494 RepID=UPI000947572E|nr:transcriptional regulator [Paraburkholderia sp. SOS3]APR34842.1 transcriptional regulator [Paraburkholderia sp. SOS3]